jgi:hypothetical protein
MTTWPAALAWRLRRQFLDPIGDEPVEAVVRRLGAVQAQHAAATELSIRVRRALSQPGEVARALADGRLIKTFAFRGATHLMAPEDAGVWLALRASSRMWELPSWRKAYRLEPSDWPAFREAVGDALRAGPLTRPELGAAVTTTAGLTHLGFAFAEPSWALVKALFWQGVMSFGPPRDGQPTFQRLDANPRWAGIPELDDAGPRAVESYLRAYGPATPGHVNYWLGNGLGAGGKRIHHWISRLGSVVAAVQLDGVEHLILAEDRDDLAVAEPSTAVRLLPGYDQWVLGPGTADPHVVPPAHRDLVSRGAAVAVVGGAVAGTWSLRKGRVQATWLGDAPAAGALAAEAARVEGLLVRGPGPES